MDFFHVKSLHNPGFRLPKLHLDEGLLPRAATLAMLLIYLFAGTVFYLTFVLLSALHAW